MNPAKAEAIRLYAEGNLTHQEVAERVGRAPSTVSQWLRRQAIDEGRYTNKDDKFRSLPPPPPPDTRTLSARLLGDPLPGRSALDQKMQGGV